MLTKLIFLALVGVLGDYTLNAWSVVAPDNQTLAALRPYWSTMGAGGGALAAGGTTLIAGLLVFQLQSGFETPSLYAALFWAFVVGFLGDLLINGVQAFWPKPGLLVRARTTFNLGFVRSARDHASRRHRTRRGGSV